MGYKKITNKENLGKRFLVAITFVPLVHLVNQSMVLFQPYNTDNSYLTNSLLFLDHMMKRLNEGHRAGV